MRRKLLTILAVTALVFGVSAGAQQRELQSVRRTDQGVEVTLSGGDGGVLIGTAYDPAGALTGLKMLQTVPGQNQYLLPGREISRVMLWESAQTMRPLGAAQNVIPEVRAFPGAEGGGKYTKGARTADVRDVYHVTNLNASGSGSLAYGLESMKSGTGRIIVFDIGGTIDLSERTKSLRINHPNVTILGQTAPGDGITVIGTDVLIEADQVILQHLRIRPGDQGIRRCWRIT